MAGVLSHVVTYQGYQVQRCVWRRSPGLEPEFGTVDILAKDLKKIDVEARAVPWRSSSGAEMPSPLSIEAWSKHSRTTTTAPGEQQAPSGGGLAMFGDLNMETKRDGKTLGQPVSYRDVYVAPSGLEEVGPVTSGRRAHNEGLIRVAITDIRAYYEDSGCFLGGINVRLKSSGRMDPSTLKGGRTPWTAAEVFRFLFSQLPGSPIIHSQSDLFGSGFENAPSDIVGEGEPVKQVLARLLERYGLVASLLPDNQYMLNRKVSSKVPYGRIPTDPSTFRAVDDVVIDERKNVAFAKRPSAVLVVGRRRIRRFTAAYVPVCEDPADGKIYQLAAIAKRWGYPLEKIQKQLLSGEEKAFRDIGPTNKRMGFLRAQALRKWAYRGYAPAFMFDGPGSAVTEDDLARHPFLPMVDAPWYQDELAKIGTSGAKTVSHSSSAQWALFRPIVFASRFAPGLYKDYEELERVHRERSAFRSSLLEAKKAEVAQTQKLLALKADVMSLTSKRGHTKIDQARAQGLGVSQLIVAATQDAALAVANAILVPLGPNEAEDQMAELNFETKRQAEALGRQLKAQAQSLKEFDDAYRKTQQHWEKVKDVFKVYEGIGVWHNHPHGPVEPGNYSIDLRTGILMFAEPCCQVAQSFLWTREGAQIVADGSVSVVYGYELKGWNVLDWSTCLYVTQDSAKDMSADCGPAQAVFAGFNRASAIKPRPEKDPNLRIYEDEGGQIMNAAEAATAGLARAEGALSGQKAATGWTYKLTGLQKAVLDSGVSSVQHQFDVGAGEGEAFASTHVMVNAPGARGPAGAGFLNERTNTALAQAGEHALLAQGD